MTVYSTWQEAAHPTVIQLYKAGDLALNPAQEIAALPLEMQERVISEKGVTKILKALRHAKTEVKRNRLFETLNGLLATVERSEAELDLEAQARALWHEVKVHALDIDRIRTRHQDRLEPSPQTIRATEARIGFLRLKPKARLKWLRHSLEEAQRLKVISDQQEARFSEQRKRWVSGFSRRFELAAIFDKLEGPLQKKFLRDNLRHYHPDKYPGDISEQERRDREAICKVLTEVNRNFTQDKGASS